MTQQRQAQLEQLGFRRIHSARGLAGERLWWRRTGSALDIVRQRDEATKRQDLGEGHPHVPDDTPARNRQWALALAADAGVFWRR